MLGGMEPVQTARLARAAEEKLALARDLTREERLALLARLLAVQETRQERKYGSA